MTNIPQVDALYIGLMQGKPAWIGKYQLEPDGMWFNARSNYGVIMYGDEASALAGARVIQSKDLEWEAAQRKERKKDICQEDI